MKKTVAGSRSKAKPLSLAHLASAGTGLGARLDCQYRVFADHYRSARKKLRRKAVHDLRSSSRRLIAALEVLEPLEIPLKTEKARTELKTLLDELRDLRDLQVGMKRLRKECPSPFLEVLRRHERRERKTARKAIRGFKRSLIRNQIKDLVRYLERSADLEPSFEVQLETLCSEHLHCRYDRILEALEGVPRRSPPPASVHQVRIQFKKLRYAWEFIAPSSFSRGPLNRAFRGLQDELGDIQDLHVFLAMLVRLEPKGLESYARALAFRQEGLIRRFHTTQAPVLATVRASLPKKNQSKAA